MAGERKPVITKGRVWVGMFRGEAGHLGWLMPPFLNPNRGEGLSEEQKDAIGNISRKYAGDMTFYRVEVKLTPLKDRRGNFIKRLPKSKREVKP